MGINFNLFILCFLFKFYIRIFECFKGIWDYKYERGYKRFRGDGSLLFYGCFGLCFRVFYFGVVFRMMLYRCLKGMGFYFLEFRVRLYCYWKDFSDLLMGR